MLKGLKGAKIKVVNPIVEMDGGEMARVIWHQIKNKVRFAHNVLADTALPGLEYSILRFVHNKS